MSIDISKVKAGDQVRIANGDWVECGTIYALDEEFHTTEFGWLPMTAITDHSPAQPEPPVEEWVTFLDVIHAPPSGTSSVNDLCDYYNTAITRKYGPPPIVRTYNGEPPEEFGLTKDSVVMLYDGGIEYAYLDPGDRWMKQPAKPGEVG